MNRIGSIILRLVSETNPMLRTTVSYSQTTDADTDRIDAGR